MLNLICAATSIEARACQKGVRDWEEQFEVLVTGIGLNRAARALRQRLAATDRPRPTRIISSGFAGSSLPDAKIGYWIVGKSVSHSSTIKLHCERFTSFFWKAVDVASVDEVVSLAAQPSSLRTVDMESFALAQIASEAAIEFQIMRLLSDTPEAPIPEVIGAFATGGIRRGLGLTLRHPTALANFLVQSSRLPKLLREGWEQLAPQIAKIPTTTI